MCMDWSESLKIALLQPSLSHTLMIKQFQTLRIQHLKPQTLVTFKRASGIHPPHHYWDSHPPPLYVSNPQSGPSNMWKKKSWNKINPILCEITFESQLYSIRIPRGLQSCTTSTNQRREIEVKQEYISAKELLACYIAQTCNIWKEGKSTCTCSMEAQQSSRKGFLTFWPPTGLDFHVQWKWIQKANESILDAFISLKVHLGAQSCFSNGENPFYIVCLTRMDICSLRGK